MSKFVKELMAQDLRSRLGNVNEALLVNVAGVSAGRSWQIRHELRAKGIHLLMVKNRLARVAMADTPMASAFTGVDGSTAVIWGAEDIVSLAKEVVRIAADKANTPFEPRGGVLDGEHLTAADVEQVAKWPSREEMLSRIVGQILSPGATLSGQLVGSGGALASQIKQIAEKEGGEEAAA